MTSRISKSRRLSPKERFEHSTDFIGLSEEEAKLFISSETLKLETADRMIENVIGYMPIPLGIAEGLVVNGREYFVPMATEQRSVISMVTKGAEWSGTGGGFKATTGSSLMIGQIQLLKVPDFKKARRTILANKESILQEANTQSGNRKAVDLKIRGVDSSIGPMLIVELLVDVKDSMGANIVNSMCEAVAPMIKRISGGQVNVRVVSDLATDRLVHVETNISENVFGKGEVTNRIVNASAFAENDPFRAATHNKGIMNGVSAVLLATCNDTRAVEAGAHAYAAMSGQYRPLSVWRKDAEGNLRGELTMPMAVGIVGGVISTHLMAKAALKILRVRTAAELGEVAASSGLAYNLGALQALVTSGIDDS